MEAFVITATLFGSFATAFVIQRAALEGLFRMMDPESPRAAVTPLAGDSCATCASRGAGSSVPTAAL